MGKEYKFQKLTPSTNVNMDVYGQALEYAFKNDDIRNIAISGAYGAGKSSMIESYKKAYPGRKFIHISLAHFTDQEKQADDEKQIIALEGKIINQLIHQIDTKNIPLTNFRIKKDIDSKTIMKLAILISIFIAITCFLCFKNTWENMVNGFSIPWLRAIFSFTLSTDIELILGMVALIIMGLAIYQIIILQQSMKIFKRMSLQGNEIEIFGETNDSYFDKYLNEVLYIFEHAGVDGIVFEDIDRYNTNLIFEKLREINYLLNQRYKNSSVQETTKSIRFIYLLRDDIFVTKDRTKFFDFIIPIVPVVDASNAYDKFLEYFKESNLLNLFDPDFLQDLSLYVDDMRVLKNICNEFVIYSERLKTSFTEKSNNKLLAMITYKNLFPKDFGCLQTGTGYVHTLFARKEEFKKSEINRLKGEIKKLENENKEINLELCEDIDELNSIYFTINGRVRVGGKEESEYKSRKEFVKAILSSNNVSRYTSSYYSSGWESISIDREKSIMEENAQYIERKLRLTQRSEHKVGKNKHKISMLSHDIEKIEHSYLKDIITRENEKDIFSVCYENVINETENFEEVKRSPYFALIKYLIRNGYIDETYSDYMTYFYENSITANDKIFLRSITDKIAKTYDYNLNDATLVVSRMRIIDFKEEEALNINVLEELLSNRKHDVKKLENFMYNIWNREPIEFVVNFLRKSEKRKDLVKELNLYWESTCRWILSEEIETEDKRQYIADTFCVSQDEIILKQNQENEIKQYVEADDEFLSIDDMEPSNIEHVFELLSIRFRYINFKNANERLLKYVYEHDMYDINVNMIKNILEYFYNIECGNDFLTQNLSLIQSDQNQPLCRYVMGNINSYLELLFSTVDEFRDTIDVILHVLNSKDVLDQNKQSYLDRTSTGIDYLLNVENRQLWSYILMRDKINKNVENICDYYYLSGNGMDDNLIDYINRFENCPELNKIDLDVSYGEESKKNLFYDIIKSNSLDNDKYENFVCAFNNSCIELSEKNLSRDKVNILINHDILIMNIDNLDMIRKYYPDNLKYFILKNINKYVELMDKSIFVSSELLYILSADIEETQKLKLLQFESEPLSIVGKNYSSNIQDYIVENLYNEDDFEYLVQWYPETRETMRAMILKIAIEEVDQIKEIQYKIHPELFVDLVKSKQIELSDKRYIIAKQVELGLDRNLLRDALDSLHMTEYQQLLDGKRPKIPATLSNEKLLDALLKRNWISSYGEDKEDSDYFQTYGKRKME